MLLASAFGLSLALGLVFDLALAAAFGFAAAFVLVLEFGLAATLVSVFFSVSVIVFFRIVLYLYDQRSCLSSHTSDNHTL